MRRALTVQLCVSCVDAALMSARAAWCVPRGNIPLTLCPATSAQGGGGAADGRQEIHENSSRKTRRALTTQRRSMFYALRDETRARPSSPPSHPHRPAGRTRDAHLDDHHRVRPRRALLPPLVCSRPDDPRDDGIGPTSTPRSCLENHADPPWCGRRAADAWRPRTHADFLDGGAYPEIDVVQLPAGLGWGANAPASDHPDRAWASPRRAGRQFRHPPDLRRATRAPPRPRLPRSSADARGARAPSPLRRTTAEYDTVVAYFARVFRSENEGENTRARWRTRRLDRASSCAYANTLLDAHPNARSPLRVRDVQPNAVAGLVLEPPAHGVPTIVSDAGRDWRQGASWGFDGLAARLGDEMVTCNDRAPARRADATSAHGKQRTCALPVREYLEHAGTTGERRSGRDGASGRSVLLNGWRSVRSLGSASEASESVASRAFPPPYFTSAMDHTRAIVEETHRRLLPRAPAGSAEATADGLDAALGKMFVGPAGRSRVCIGTPGRRTRGSHKWLVGNCSCVARRTTLRRSASSRARRRRRNRRWTRWISRRRPSPRRNFGPRRARRVHARTGGGGGDSARLVALRGRHRSRVDGDAQLLSRGDERGGARARHRGEADREHPRRSWNSLLWKAHRQLLVPARCVSRPVRLIRRIFSCNSRTSS